MIGLEYPDPFARTLNAYGLLFLDLRKMKKENCDDQVDLLHHPRAGWSNHFQ